MLAERAGLSVRGISDLERGARRLPRLETVRLLANALELAEPERAALLTAARPELDMGGADPVRLSKSKRPIAPRPLPIPPTRLIGRDAEIERIAQLFRSGDARLITLTGQGGIGKSRLGLAIARGFAREFGGRVAFLELAAVRDAELVPGAMATQLGIAIDAGESVTSAMVAAIGQEPALLVVDNWEHVLEAAPVLSLLLGHCEGLWVLATSRERLRLRGEWEVRVDPLAIPEDGNDLEVIAAAPAVRLFVQRASEASNGFALDTSNAPVVLEIVRRLDGIPLAIELTAARARALPPHVLLERLGERLQLLTEGPRDLPERLQTMRSAIAWSVDLLDENERQLFERLSVFSGGFTLSAVTGLMTAIDPDRDALAIEEVLFSLVDKSLVRPLDIGGDEPRFAVYETIRDFARERLNEGTETDRVAGAHASYFLMLAETSEAGLMSPDPMPTFTMLESEIANLRAALRYLFERDQIEAALRIASALAWFWTEPRFIPEGQRWLRVLLERSGDGSVPDDLRARALIAAGDLAIWQSELDRAAALHGEALELLRATRDDRKLVAVLRSLANVAMERGEFDRADTLLAESSERADRAGYRWEVAASANLIGLNQTMRGSPEQAIAPHRQAAEILQELGDRSHLFDALAGLGWAQLQVGRIEESARTYLDAVSLAVESDDVLQIEWCIRAAAVMATLRGSELERATRLFSVSEAMREESGIDLRVAIGETIGRCLDDLRTQLGAVRFARGWQAGRRMGRPQALDDARSIFEKIIA